MNKSIGMLSLALMTICSLNCVLTTGCAQTGLSARTATPFSFVMDLECTEMSASFSIDAALARRNESYSQDTG